MAVFDGQAFVLLLVLACAVTLLAALSSAVITWIMDVDETSSMKLSRSVHTARQDMVFLRRSRFQSMLGQVLEDGTDARFAAAGSQSAKELDAFPPGAQINLDDDGFNGKGDDVVDVMPQCNYSRFEVSSQSCFIHEDDYALELNSERQLRLDPGAISLMICFSVLIYDVLGLVVCFLWASMAIRLYSVVLGRLAVIHSVLYALSVLVYAAVVVVGVTRFVILFFP